MSVNRFYKNPTSPDKELELIASKGQRTFVGTKAAVQAAMEKGDIGNASLVYITDDYAENRIPELISDDTVNISGNKVAFLDKGGKLTADKLNAGATMDGKDVATTDKVISYDIGDFRIESEDILTLPLGKYWNNWTDWASLINPPPVRDGYMYTVLRTRSEGVDNWKKIIAYSQEKSCIYTNTLNSKGVWTGWQEVAITDQANPTGTIIPVLGNKKDIPGYLCCDGTKYEKTKYPRLAEFLGEQFSVDATYFSIDLRNRFLQSVSKDSSNITVDDWGKKEEAALPNILGRSTGMMQWLNNPVFTEAFKDSVLNEEERRIPGAQQGAGFIVQTLDFDASRSDSIYKTEVHTVQPPAIRTYYYIKY